MPTVTVADVFRKGNMVHSRSHDTNVTCRRSVDVDKAHSAYGNRYGSSTESTTDRRCKTSLAITRTVTDHYEFEESYNAMQSEFDTHDYLSNGFVSKPDFSKILQEFGYYIPVVELDGFLHQNGVRSRLGQINYRDFLETYEKSEGSILTDRSTCSSLHMDLGPVVNNETHSSNKKVSFQKNSRDVRGTDHYENNTRERTRETSTWSDNQHRSEVVAAENWADRTTDLQITGKTYREPYDKVTANQKAVNSKKQFTKHVGSHNKAFRDAATNQVITNKNNVDEYLTNERVGNQDGEIKFSTNETSSKESWAAHPSNEAVTFENWEKSNKKELSTNKQTYTEENRKDSKSITRQSTGTFPMTQNQLDSHITTQIMASRANSAKQIDTKARRRLEQSRSYIFTPPNVYTVHSMLPQANFSFEELQSRVTRILKEKSPTLISNFRTYDKLNLGVITQPEFQSALETVLGFHIPDHQWNEIRPRFGQDLGGLVPYNDAIQNYHNYSKSGMEGVLKTSRIIPKKLVNPNAPKKVSLPPKTYRKPHVQMNNWTVHDVQAPECGAGGVPVNSKTSEYYRTDNIPNRFDNPDWFEGYEQKKQHPMYRTSSSDYGAKKPSVHTMPTMFHAKSQKFSKHLGTCGMYRNHSLNTHLDQSRV
ncbi:hypothetical protein FSP39_015700 [Pinctada imbricata]|uniref:EF-hand domain-containing protein n=1 Tax=Pinctada imbricata TaxID=66713 RepID=A0AA89C035_PINIB|nr:hypothetical protein FSP39_015700 [Pinctada imbricata]